MVCFAIDHVRKAGAQAGPDPVEEATHLQDIAHLNHFYSRRLNGHALTST